MNEQNEGVNKRLTGFVLCKNYKKYMRNVDGKQYLPELYVQSQQWKHNSV